MDSGRRITSGPSGLPSSSGTGSSTGPQQPSPRTAGRTQPKPAAEHLPVARGGQAGRRAAPQQAWPGAAAQGLSSPPAKLARLTGLPLAPLPLHGGHSTGAPVGLADLPAELQDRVTSFMRQDTLASFGTVMPAVAAPHRASVHATEQAKAVARLADVHALIRPAAPGLAAASPGISDLRLDLRAEPLLALGHRLMALPTHEQAPALAAFCHAVDQLTPQHRPAALNELAKAATLGPDDLMLHIGDLAQAAVQGNEPVPVAAARFGIHNPQGIAALEEVASEGLAGQRVKADQRGIVDTVASQHGILSERGRAALELQAAKGVAGDRAWHATEPLPVIKGWYGIRSAQGVGALETEAVKGRTVGERAWRGEESMEAIAKAHGIESTPGKAALDWQAVHGPGVKPQRLENGRLESRLQIHDRLGITTVRSADYLYAFPRPKRQWDPNI